MTAVEKLWRSHLEYILLTRNCHRVGEPNTASVVVDYLNEVLPPLALLQTVSVLDEVFEDFINNSVGVLPKPYRNDLNGRIEFLAATGKIGNTQSLHDLRKRRNELAHEASKAFSGNSVSWTEVDGALALVQNSLIDLGLFSTPPQFEFHCGRDVESFLDGGPPDNPDLRMRHHYYYGVKERDQWTIQFRKSININRIGIGSSP